MRRRIDGVSCTDHRGEHQPTPSPTSILNGDLTSQPARALFRYRPGWGCPGDAAAATLAT
jgi:hypothetical protein